VEIIKPLRKRASSILIFVLLGDRQGKSLDLMVTYVLLLSMANLGGG
jgi:hypothetical protein